MGRFFLVRRNRRNWDDLFDQFGSYSTITEARRAAYRANKNTSQLIEVYSNGSNYVGTVYVSSEGERSWVTDKQNEYKLKSDGTLGESLYRQCRSRR